MENTVDWESFLLKQESVEECPCLQEGKQILK